MTFTSGPLCLNLFLYLSLSSIKRLLFFLLSHRRHLIISKSFKLQRPISHQLSQTRFVSRGSLATMSSHDPSRFDDSEDEEDFNPAPADMSDEEQDGDDKQIKRGSSPAPRDDDDDEDERPSKSRHADDDDEEEEEEEEEDDNPKRRDDDEDEDDEEDDEDEDDVQQVSSL
ncbi:Quinate dehydrogenase [Fusarium oxysporum f. sp. albedinis]|nr:Quinate dehydrogenase [Fusarium oxysporum f. sp. albedinis]